jgi:hypothetical protein
MLYIIIAKMNIMLVMLDDPERFLHDENSKDLDFIAKDIEDELDIFLRLFA